MSLATLTMENLVAQLRSDLELEGRPCNNPVILKKFLVNMLLEKDCAFQHCSCSPRLRAAVASLSWPQALELLMQLGAAVDDRNCQGDTALHVAFVVDETSQGLQILMNRFLLAAKENFRNYHGLSLLHIACARSSSAIVQHLLCKFLPDIDCRVSAAFESPYAGYTSLHFAVHHGQSEIAALLLNHDADFYEQDNNGSSPLHLALNRGDINMIDMILLNDHLFYNCVNNSGLTHFMIACACSCTEVVNEFIRSVETVRRLPPSILINDRVKDSRHPYAGYTPLHFAARYGNLETVKLLLRHGASGFAIDFNNATPLDVARASGFEAICQLLQRSCEDRQEELLISWMKDMSCA